MALRHSPIVSACARALRGCLLAAMLAACGGGGGDAPAGAVAAAGCALDEQKAWLGPYMDREYLWYATKPDPDPSPFASIGDYFRALLSPGVAGDENLPFDRWSSSEPAASFNRFYGEGRTLGYGLFVAGLEVQGSADPLRVRYVEPASPAAAAGLSRGETIVSINGTAASSYTRSSDFSLLTPSAEGERLRLVVRNGAGAERDVELTAAVFALTPLSVGRIVSSPAGTPIGYLVLKDFVSQALGPLDSAFAAFAANGVREVVLDLRYNGGGLVSVASTLASHLAGASAANQTFALLRYNDKRQALNTTYAFSVPPSALSLSRVFVLSGPRTCSASELVINGLAPFVPVVQIGAVTCGKPVGFVPAERCGTTFSAVNFESENAVGRGRYWNGLSPSDGCARSDDLDHPLGDADEGLLAAARQYVDTNACPAVAARERPQRSLPSWLHGADEGERKGVMIAR